MDFVSAISPEFDVRRSGDLHLSLLCTWEGISFCVFDTQQNIFTALKYIPYPKPPVDYNDLGEAAGKIVKGEFLLRLPYRQIRCIYPTECCTLIPKDWAQPHNFKAQLELNHTLNELDEIHCHPLPIINADCIFAVPGTLTAKLREQLGNVEYIHQSMPLLHNLMQCQNDENASAAFAVNIHTKFADIAFCMQSSVQFYNTFASDSPQNIIYFMMLLAHSHNVDVGQAKVVVSGDIDHYVDELLTFFTESFRCKPLPTQYSPELQEYALPCFDLLFAIEKCV